MAVHRSAFHGADYENPQIGKKTKSPQRSSTDRGVPRRGPEESGVAITVRWGAPRSRIPRSAPQDAQFLDAFMGCAPLVGDPAGKREAPAGAWSQGLASERPPSATLALSRESEGIPLGRPMRFGVR